MRRGAAVPAESTFATNKRVSVFERLGPSPDLPTTPSTSTSPGPVENQPPHRLQTENKDTPNASDPKAKESPLKPPSSGMTPGNSGVHLKPNALLHRTLKEVKKDRARKALSDPATAVEELQKHVDRLEKDKHAAEELADALLLSQQALLQDKTKLQIENATLLREVEQLNERLEFLHFAESAGISSDPLVSGVHPIMLSDEEDDLVYTPNPAMLRELREAGLDIESPSDIPSFSDRLNQEGQDVL